MNAIIKKWFQPQTNTTFSSESLLKLVQHSKERIESSPITFPIYHYFLEKFQTVPDTQLKQFLDQHHTHFIFSLLFQPLKNILELSRSLSKDQLSVKNCHDLSLLLTACHSELQEEIPDPDIQHEHEHLQIIFNTFKPPPESVPTSPGSSKVQFSNALLHPSPRIRTFRQHVKGRSWLSPHIYSFLFLVWHLPKSNDFFSLLPSSVIRYKDLQVQKYLTQNKPKECNPLLWTRICSDLPSNIYHPILKDMEEKIFQISHPDLLQIWFTLTQHNWGDLWSQMPWKKKRSIVTNIRLYRQQLSPFSTQDISSLMMTTFEKVGYTQY